MAMSNCQRFHEKLHHLTALNMLIGSSLSYFLNFLLVLLCCKRYDLK